MKKLLFMLLVTILVMSAARSQQVYYDFSAVAPSGQTLYYWIVDGNAHVTSQTFQNEEYYLTYPTGDLVIPATVTYNSVTYSVTSIGSYAFYGCSGLTSVIIPDSVTSIDYYAFYGCTGLTTITIPDNVTWIGEGAFSYCSGLSSVILGNSVTSIGEQAFTGCVGLTSTIYTGTIAQWCGISFSLYSSNPAFFSSNLTIEGTELTNLIIPEGVTEIKQYAFPNCFGLTSVTIPNTVVSIGVHSFSYCIGLTSLTIPDGVTSIDAYAFQGCSGLTSITISDSVISIGNSAFSGCSGLTSVTISDNFTSIGNNAFSYCDGLTSITIGSSVSSISNCAFAHCNGLTEITSFAPIAPQLSNNSFLEVSPSIPVYIPCGSLQSYQLQWSYFSNFIEVLGFSISATTVDSATGHAEVITVPTCEAPTSVVNAVPAYGYHFSRWSDGNTDNPRTLTVTQDTTLEALFEIATYSVTVGNALGSGNYTHGSTALLAALPQVDLQFAGWSDGETANPRYIVVTSDTTLTALFRAPDTVRVYDTTTVYDTVINIVYDTTEYNHYFYDTTRVYDTLIVLDTIVVYDIMINIIYDTTEYNHYFYDTISVFDTLVVLDTTRVYDTMVYVNIDTLHHYYYDTTRVFDTLVNLDTVHHYIFDSTMVYDTMIYVHIDTLHHYQYDTTYTVDTLFFFDTTSVTHYVFDSTWVFDSVWEYDTVYVLDTIYFFDTVYIQVPVQGIDGVEMVNVKVYTYSTQIIVEGAQGMAVRLYDVNGRLLATKMEDAPITYFYVQTSGTYLVRVGDHPARRVVVIR